MTKKNLILGVLVIYFFFSCSSEEEKEETKCLKDITLTDIVVLFDESSTLSLKEVYSNSAYEIFISSFFTPNGDAVNDSFTILIKDLTNETFYISRRSGTIFIEIEDSTREYITDPNLFIKSGYLSISNECDDLFTTNDIENFYWDPGLLNEGTYNINLKLTLFDETEVQLNEKTEILHTSSFLNMTI